MVTMTALWLPILLSSILVFFASFMVWAVLPFHRSDYKALPDEDAAVRALRPQKVPPGLYNIPNVPDRSDIKKPEVQQRFAEGPVAFMTVLPGGTPAMGKPMVLSFIFYVVVGVVVAYLAGRTLSPGTEYLTVFRVTGTVAWVAHGFAIVPDAIWFGKPWKMIWKQLLDALIYGLLTAGAFAGFWPDA